jgi:flagellar hook-associated protein 3 FlgL
MSGALSLRFSTQAQLDIRRITRELADLQAQVASGSAAADLQGFGPASSRLITSRSLKASSDARASAIEQLQARFGVQSAALGQVAQSARLLSQSIREAISAGDGRGITIELDVSFASIVTALNQTWNGQPLFAGERQGNAGPIKITTLDQLLAATTPDDIFNEAARPQTFDLGAGEPVTIAPKASQLSQGLFDTLRELKELLNAAGGSIGQPIDAANTTALLDIVAQLDAHAATFNTEEGRSGQLQKRFETELAQLQERSNLIVKEIGAQADADLGQVSVRLSALMVQYEASAKTFAELSRLSLLDYL